MIRINKKIRTYFFLFLFALGCLNIQAQETKSLRQLIAIAEENNSSLQIEKLNLDIALSEIQSAKIRPNLTFTNETVQIIGKKYRHPTLPWNNKLNREESWFLGKPLQVAGQRKHKVDLAKENLKLEELNFHQTKTELYGEIVEQWKETLLVEQKYGLVAFIKDDYSELITEKAEASSLKIDQSRYSVLLKIAEIELVNAYTSLADLVGVEYDFKIDPAEIQIFFMDEDWGQWEELVLDNRNDLKILDYHQNISNLNLKLQKAQAIPQPEVGAIWNPKDGLPFVGLYISFDIPVFDRNQGEIRKAQIENEQIRLLNEDFKGGLKTDLQNSLNHYRRWREVVLENQENLAYYDNRLADAKKAFLEGKVTVDTYKEIMEEWKQAQEEHLDYLDKFMSSQIDLFLLTETFN